MTPTSRVLFLCTLFVSSVALAQSTTQEDLGVITASQAASGLGWQVDANNEVEFAAAAAAGATHIRIAACMWSDTEQQSAPPNNVSAGYVLAGDCATGLSLSKKYGFQPTVIAAYGAPYHQILTLSVASAGAAGDTSISVQYTSSVGGDTLSSISYPYDYLLGADGSQISKKHGYEGDLITGITVTGSTAATLSLASALTQPLAAGTQLAVNEILYPSAINGLPSPSLVAYSKYAQFLAKQINAYGLTGTVELWNEPPWFDCWDNRIDCYDVDPKFANELRGNSANFGLAAVMQTTTPVAGVNYTWAGTNKTGGADLLGPSLLKYSGVSFIEPQLAVTAESFHPYGRNPEDAMWNQPCLVANPQAAQGCNTVPAKHANFVLAEENNLIAQAASPGYGIDHTITETGASTMYMPPDHMARFMTRQYLGFMAEDFSVVEFYRLYDTSEPGQDGFSFMTSPDNGISLLPLPAYTALSGLMADLGTMSLNPVASYSASTLPTVTSYSGTYNLDTLSLVGARPGDKANSIMYVVFQRSVVAPPCVDGVTQCWGTLAQPAGAPTTLSLPAGVKVAQVVNLDTREDVDYTQSGSSIQLSVSDDPIEIMLVPSGDSTKSLTVPDLSFPTVPVQMQGNVIQVFADSNSPGAISYSLVSGAAQVSGNTVTMTGTGTVVIKASQAAKDNYTATTATTSFNVTGVAPALAFNPITPKTYGNTLVVKATSASPGAVTYSVVSGPATVSGNAVTMTGSGTVTLGASQAASGFYTSATATISFPVSPITTTLVFAKIPTATYGDTVTVSATSASNGAVTYSVVSGVGTISGNVVTPTNEGQIYLKATQAATNGYTAATALANFHVNAATPTLVFDSIPTEAYNTSFTVNASSASNGSITYSIVSGPASISGSTVTTLSTNGTVVLKAYQAVSGGYGSATATTSFNVAQQPSTTTLVFTSIPSQTYGDPPFTVSASSASSGTITYSVVSGPATISGSTVTLTGVGTVTLQASQAASGNYGAATATTSFTVSPATPALAFSSIASQTYGNSPFTVSASSASSGKVTYSVVSGPATISGNTVTLNGTGTVQLQASQAARGNYGTATATTSFSVSVATPTLVFSSIPSQTYGNAPLSVNATSASSGTVTYSVVSGPASISGNTVTLNGAGIVVLQAVQAANGNYDTATATTSISVSVATPTLVFSGIPSQVYGNPAFQVSASSESGGAITYSVLSGPATISGSTVTLTGGGTVVLKASQAANGNYGPATAKTSFTVTSAALTFASISRKVAGDVFTVSATSSSSGAISYIVVSGPAIVVGNIVTVTGPGTTVLQANQDASGNNPAATATTTFTSVNSTSLTFASIASQTYGNVPVTVSATSTSSAPITYSVQSGPATLAGNTATLTGAGTVVIQAAQKASATNAAATANISFTVAQKTPTLSIAGISPQTAGAVFTVNASSDSNGPIQYSVVSGPATVAGATVTTLTTPGNVTLQATQAASGNYGSATATIVFPVVADSASLAFASVPSHTYGDVFAVSASSASNGAITYSVLSGPAAIAGNVVTTTGAGLVILQASQAASGPYPASTATTSVTVLPVNPMLVFVPITPKTFGNTLGVRAISPSPAAITYSVVSGPATISGNTVTMIGAGNVVLGANQAASDGFAAAATTISFPVSPDPQPLTFINITPKTAGYSFGIRATSDSPGQITYSVVSGPATLSGTTITLTGGGVVTLRADQAASGVYPVETAAISFAVASN